MWERCLTYDADTIHTVTKLTKFTLLTILPNVNYSNLYNFSSAMFGIDGFEWAVYGFSCSIDSSLYFSKAS